MELNLQHYEDILEKLSPEECQAFADYVEFIVVKQTDIKKKKFSSQLDSSKPSSKFPTNPERYVHNLSSLNLNETLLDILSLGPKFCFPSRKTEQLDLEIQFESLFDQLSDLTPSSHSKVEYFKTTLVNSCYQYLNQKVNVSQIIKKITKKRSITSERIRIY